MLLDMSVDKDKNIYKGLVEDNADPKKLGRVKVRIPSIWGNPDQIPTACLPWASVLSPNAGADSGTFIVPEIGSTVYVRFENNDHDLPIVLGSVYTTDRTLPVRQAINTNAHLSPQGLLNVQKLLDRGNIIKKIQEKFDKLYQLPEYKKVMDSLDKVQGCLNDARRDVDNITNTFKIPLYNIANFPPETQEQIKDFSMNLMEVDASLKSIQSQVGKSYTTILGTPYVNYSYDNELNNIISTQVDKLSYPVQQEVQRKLAEMSRKVEIVRGKIDVVRRLENNLIANVDKVRDKLISATTEITSIYNKTVSIYNTVNRFVGFYKSKDLRKSILESIRKDMQNEWGRIIDPFTTDTPKDSQDNISKRVVYKSPKGSKVLMDETDGQESLLIEDANGQQIELTSPIRQELIKSETFKLGDDKAYNLKAPARVSIKNPFKDEIQILSDGKKSHINIVSGETKRGLEIDTEKKFTRLFTQTKEPLELIITDDDIAIQTQKAIFKIKGGVVTVLGSSIEMKAPTISLNASSLKFNASSINFKGNISSDSDLPREHFATHGGSGGTASVPSNSIQKWELPKKKE